MRFELTQKSLSHLLKTLHMLVSLGTVEVSRTRICISCRLQYFSLHALLLFLNDWEQKSNQSSEPGIKSASGQSWDNPDSLTVVEQSSPKWGNNVAGTAALGRRPLRYVKLFIRTTSLSAILMAFINGLLDRHRAEYTPRDL